MGYLFVSECRVAPDRMQEFTAHIQHWEQDALHDADSPRYHAVYLREGDPTRVLLVAEFGTRDEARRFEDSGRFAEFRQAVESCLSDEPTDMEGFELYYAATPSGPSVAFGESTHHLHPE